MLSFVSEDQQDCLQKPSTSAPIHTPPLQSGFCEFDQPIALLHFGRLRIFFTTGSPISLDGCDDGMAQLVIFVRNLISCSVDQPGFELPIPESILYVPPGSSLTENIVTAAIVTFVQPEDLLQTALAMVDADSSAIHVHSAFVSPRLISVDHEPCRQLASFLYSVYQHLDSLNSLGDEILRQSRIDDQILRLWALLLIPELYATLAGSGEMPLVDAASVWVKELAQWIAANADRPLTLIDLERQSGYSRRSLQLAFRAVLGCTPMQWVKRCRMQKARERLESPKPGDSVASVATMTGFCNAAAFTRDFIRLHGEKPSAVLRQARRRLAAPFDPSIDSL